jgi:hypothetical protein
MTRVRVGVCWNGDDMLETLFRAGRSIEHCIYALYVLLQTIHVVLNL